MQLSIAKDGWPYIAGSLVLFGLAGFACQVFGWPTASLSLYAGGIVTCGFMVYFFRDPERTVEVSASEFLSGADGRVRSVELIREDNYLKADTVRLSVFLSPFNVHVNRAPIGGRITELDYTPGKRLLTIQNAASEHNEHSSILIQGQKTRCLVRQIVGPVVRRVVYWLDLGQDVNRGERIGIMKFGSRMDIYFPAEEVEVLVGKGDKVVAGKTVVARLKAGRAS